ncbi:mechanosensitive channel protein [Halomonas cupida]|uniref:mechanosensitive channel protein n=1 Tax=Halomonas cupida TaxID=44933 RepID=UPI0039B6DA4A
MPSRFCSMIFGLLLLVGMTVTSPVIAQQAEPPASSEGPAYSTLADMLENDEARTQLIEQLRQLAEASPEAATATEQEPVASEPTSLPGQLAHLTSSIVSDFSTHVEMVLDTIVVLFDGSLSSAPVDLDFFINAAINLGIIIVATVALFLVVRRLVRPLFRRLSQWSLTGHNLNPTLRLIIAVAFAGVVDALVIGLSYIGGNLVATFAVGDTGNLSTRASLFLNAFLIIELLKAAVRMLFASRYEGLRLLPIQAGDASYWNRWIARLIGLTGYGLMVVVPLVSIYLSRPLGSGVGTVIMVSAWIYAITVVMVNRHKVREALIDKARQTNLSATRVALRLLARTWHLLAIAYFTTVLVLTLTRPEDALPYVLIATLKTIGVILAAMLLSRLLVQSIGRRITLSDDLRRRLPLLEPRLNSYIPNILRAINILILIVAAMMLCGAWGVFDLPAWYASEAGRTIVSRVSNVAVILVMAIAVWIGLASIIEHRLNPNTGKGIPSARAHTLLSLFRNALAIVIVAMTAMIVLSEIGINIGPLIAGAGVLGLAIGFGAQKLVQDIITGVFIQVENAMNTGDVVTVGGITGTAEKLSIRSVGIRDLNGTYHLVPFSSVDLVSNYMRDFAYHVGEYRIAYRESVDEAIIALRNAFEELTNDPDIGKEILEPLEVAGVIALADSSVNIRVRIMTTPGNQWAVGRAYNRLVKLHFDEAGISIPFPHTTVYFGEDKQGHSPAANLRILKDQEGRAEAPAPGEDGSIESPNTHEAPKRAEVDPDFPPGD